MTIRRSLTVAAGLAVAATLVASRSLAQGQAPAPARDVRASDLAPSGTSSLAGTVVDQERHAVRRAAITISGPQQFSRTVITDDEGRFAFEALPTGRYTIVARKAGYPQFSFGAKQPFRTGSGVVVAEGQRIADLALTLAKGAAIEGTVYDQQGQPMPGVNVMAWEVRTSLTGDRVFAFPRTGGEWVTSDDRGVFRVFGLPPGEYTIGTAWAFNATEARIPTDDEIRAAFDATSGRAGAAAGTAGSTNPAPKPTDTTSVAYSPVFHPDTIDPMAAQTFKVAAGDERTGVDLRMQMRPMSRLEATVVEVDGTPVTGAEVSLIRRGRVEALNTTRVSGVSDGQYRSGTMTPGDYGFVITAPAGGDRPARSASMPITMAAGEPLKITMTLQPSPPVTGQVVFNGTALPAPNATTVRVGLTSAPGSFGNFNSLRSEVNAAGVVTITGVTAGRYRATASVPNQPPTGPAWTLRSVVADGRDVTDVPFEIAAGAPPTLTITFTDQIAELTGQLVQPSGQPGTDFFVIVLPADRQYLLPGSRRVTSTRPDITGKYVFRGLPAGEYRVAVTTELDGQDLADATILEQLIAISVPVTIGVGEKKTFDIRVGTSR